MSRVEPSAVEHVAGAALPGLLDDLHAATERLWQRAPEVPTTDRIRFETALIEVGSNIVRHGVPVGGSVSVTATLSVSGATVAADVVDDGADAELDLDPSMPDDAATSGRGLLLIQRTVDVFTYTRDGDRNVWHLSRRYVLP